MTDRGKQWKAVTVPYDAIMEYDDTNKRTVCLTDREIQVLLSLTETVGWLTRWEGNAVQDTIDALQASIEKSLLYQCEDLGTGSVVIPEFRMVYGVDCQQMQYRIPPSLTWVDIGESICNGQNGDDGICLEGCASNIPNEDDRNISDPTPTSNSKCQIATAVSKYMLAQYTSVLEDYIEQVSGLGLSLLDFGRWIIENVPLFVGLTATSNLMAWLLLVPAQSASAYLSLANDSGYKSKVKCHLYCALNEVNATGYMDANALAMWRGRILSDTTMDSAFRNDLWKFMESIPLYQLKIEALNSVVFNIASDCTGCACSEVTPLYLIKGTWVSSSETGGVTTASYASQNTGEGSLVHRVRLSVLQGEPNVATNLDLQVRVKTYSGGGSSDLFRARKGWGVVSGVTAGGTLVYNSSAVMSSYVCCSTFEVASNAAFTVTFEIIRSDCG
jgi:hypothetical protein